MMEKKKAEWSKKRSGMIGKSGMTEKKRNDRKKSGMAEKKSGMTEKKSGMTGKKKNRNDRNRLYAISRSNCPALLLYRDFSSNFPTGGPDAQPEWRQSENAENPESRPCTMPPDRLVTKC